METDEVHIYQVGLVYPGVLGLIVFRTTVSIAATIYVYMFIIKHDA